MWKTLWAVPLLAPVVWSSTINLTTSSDPVPVYAVVDIGPGGPFAVEPGYSLPNGSLGVMVPAQEGADIMTLTLSLSPGSSQGIPWDWWASGDYSGAGFDVPVSAGSGPDFLVSLPPIAYVPYLGPGEINLTWFPEPAFNPDIPGDTLLYTVTMSSSLTISANLAIDPPDSIPEPSTVSYITLAYIVSGAGFLFRKSLLARCRL